MNDKIQPMEALKFVDNALASLTLDRNSHAQLQACIQRLAECINEQVKARELDKELVTETPHVNEDIK